MIRRPPRSTLFPYTTLSDLSRKEGRTSDWEADWSSRKTVLNVFSWYELPFNIGRMRQNVSSKASSLERTFSHVFRKFSCAATKSVSGRLKTKYGRLTNFCIAASMVCGVWRRWNTSFAQTGSLTMRSRPSKAPPADPKSGTGGNWHTTQIGRASCRERV